MPNPDIAGGETVAVDAGIGRVVASPREETLAVFASRGKNAAELAEEAAKLERQPARTTAGAPVRVLINVNHPDDLASLDPAICDGVGLTRTEFLFRDGAPGENEQLAAYAAILKWAAGRPTTIRTLDAGGDKPIPGVTRDGEANPFLGLRGLRLSLRRPEIFRVQLRALLRAAALGPLKIMVPMVTLPQELVAVRRLAGQVARELQLERLPYAMPPIGMMVEVPAAAMSAGSFEADFYSIGSNDLVQYVMAVARDAAGLSHLAQADHPAVLELVRRTVEAGHARSARRGQPVRRPCVAPGNDRPAARNRSRLLSVAPASVGRVKLEISFFGGAKA